ncbi:hypothetical protein EVAR_34128_1 [Eumeta japonica]|uniref:Uncharacterized protein n=1 Tax=Eumeta variegata TaxID=151549 RepID=A0A4C1WLG4_EUMVA|nr:hypothetical protein EVAR_34128_1 [Eumeta japonica]
MQPVRAGTVVRIVSSGGSPGYRRRCVSVNDLVDRFSYYFTVATVAMNYVATLVYNAPASYDNYQVGAFTHNRVENSTLEFTVYYSFPKINQEEMFIPFTLINFYLSCAVGSFHCLLDLYLSLAVFQIIGHLYILKHSLSGIPRPKNKTFIEVYDMPIAVEMFDVEENRQVYKYISECISHHCTIIRFTDEVSVLFGPTIACSYLFHLGCCLSLLQVLSGVRIDVRYHTESEARSSAHREPRSQLKNLTIDENSNRLRGKSRKRLQFYS